MTVLNHGVPVFRPALEAAGAALPPLDWRPPARGRGGLAWLTARLLADPRVDEANARAAARFLACEPVLTGLAPAREVLPALRERRLLHAGPPLSWDEAPGPVRGALAGAILWEGWARTREQAYGLLSRGEIPFSPCHHEGVVGPMAGVVSPRMPLWIVRSADGRHTAFSNLNEGLGKVLRFGADSPEVLDRLTWMADSLGPLLADLLHRQGPLELKPLMARALQMGDELHNRNAAATGLLTRRWAPGLVALASEGRAEAGAVCRALEFFETNDHFFLNLSMAACKLMTSALGHEAGSSLVSVMARNGDSFGIRCAGTDEAWFTAPSPRVDGLYFAGYGPEDAAGDLGDSAITETAGLGGFAMAAAPAIVRFVGGSSAEALEQSRQMSRITYGPHAAFALPALDFQGTPSLIDVRKVVDLNLAPVINTGIAHREAGIGQIGAGLTRAPLDCFDQALESLAGSLSL